MVLDYENLRDAWKEESRGKSGAPNQERYKYYLEENLYSLQERLGDGTFEPTPFRIKQIYYPKRRQAQVPGLEDKIVQHAICDNYAYTPLVTPLVDGASANTRGRGTDYGAERLRKDLRAFWIKYKQPPFIVKGDIHSFFASIPHDRVLEMIHKYLDDELIQEIMKKFINLTEMGLPLGLQQSQLLANLYLSEFDHKLKERHGAKYYGRHMDDFYILYPDRKQAEDALSWIEGYVGTIGLELNPKTTILYRDFDYLGFHYTMSDTGKIIVRIAKGKLKSKRRHLKKMVRQLQSGEITANRLIDAYFGWRVHASKAKNARTQIINVDKYLDGMLREIGYKLVIYKVSHGKIRWRVDVLPIEGRQ